ncbi:MAG: ATP-dependent zinc metalloprotease FtsH [Coriobacteriia bacterium]|nr:ATP-dependent zinc metalloprotease FtsH [Coriobacteriia bacterium]
MPESQNKKRNPMIIYVAFALLIMVLIQVFVVPTLKNQVVKDVSYDQFMSMVDEKKVETVQLDSTKLEITFTSTNADGDTQYYKTGMWPNDTTLAEKLQESGAEFTSVIPQTTSPFTLFVISMLLPIVIFVGLGVWLNKKLREKMGEDPTMTFGGGGLSSSPFGKSGAKIVADTDINETFASVAGQDEAKETLSEIVDFLHDPSRYESIGAKLPKGALLVGPPGTGKTLLARAVAGEAKVPFFSMSGSEFVEMFVGRGAAKVRDLFKQANEKAPCIVFIDEIDTIGKRRDTTLQSNDEREQTLNQLLTEMDGFDNHKGIVVLGATNRPETLDPALLRPGRFDRRVPVELPDLAGREAILRLHANQVKMQNPIDFGVIARATPGASGADLANIINEAALRAVREGRKFVLQEDLMESVEVVIAGMQRKSSVLSPHEKKIVAYHEIGHALVAAKVNHKAPVTKITIVPRTSGALGYTMQVEDEENYLLSKNDIINRLKVLAGGRAAEEVVFGDVTTGAANDIERATQIARDMITRYGMSDEYGFVAFGEQQSKYLGGGTKINGSEETLRDIDLEVSKTINDALADARQILKENKFKLHELAAYLMKKETITGDEFMNILTRDEKQGEKIAQGVGA